jgi:hypothetical protein
MNGKLKNIFCFLFTSTERVRALSCNHPNLPATGVAK